VTRSGIGCSAACRRYYYTDLPFLALVGDRLFDRISSIIDYSRTPPAALPNVVMVDPGFAGPDRSDNHPHGDIRMAQRFLHSVFSAFARSPQWHRGLFVLTYDEWGGFFDHVAPPVVPDDRASKVDLENFGQTGFRVPTVLASPFARRGYVDSTRYDHTSILRFLEWRFLGAPPAGVDASNGRWYLTKRDRAAHNLGNSLVTAAGCPTEAKMRSAKGAYASGISPFMRDPPLLVKLVVGP
jgi:phospholipase C